MEPLRKGTARIEFFTVMQDVEKLLAAGYSIKLAYDHLKESGQITMSYQAFYSNLKPRKKSNSQVSTAKQSERLLGLSKESVIQHEKNPKVDDIIWSLREIERLLLCAHNTDSPFSYSRDLASFLPI